MSTSGAVCDSCEWFGAQDFGFGWCSCGKPVVTARQFSCGNWRQRPARPAAKDPGLDGKEMILMGSVDSEAKRGKWEKEVMPLYRHGEGKL